MSGERWLPVIGYEGCYEVSDMGRIRSLERMVRHRWGGARIVRARMLILTEDKGKHTYGRLQAKLSKEGKAKTRLVHHLVLEAFPGPRPDGMEGAHNDGDAANNRLDNLRYDTPLGNTADKEKHGTLLRGSAVGNSKLKESDVCEIKRLRGIMTVYEIASIFSISIAQVSRIQTGKRWGHHVSTI